MGTDNKNLKNSNNSNEKTSKTNSGDSYLKSRSKEYRVIAISIVIGLIVLVVGGVILGSVLKAPVTKLELYDKNGQLLTTYSEGDEQVSVGNELGYEFSGWENMETGEIYKNLTAALNDGATAVKQKWTLKEYTVTLYTNGGTIIDGDDTFEYHEAKDRRGEYYTKKINFETEEFLLPAANRTANNNAIVKKENNAFKFWSRVSNTNDSNTAVSKITTGQTSNTVLFAIWNENPVMLNVWNREQNKIVINDYLNRGDVLEKSWDEDPEEEGYIFMGYFKDRDLTEPFLFEGEVENNINIYTKWAPKEFNITYKNLDETVIRTVTCKAGDNIELDSFEVNPGIQFDGWAKKVDGEFELVKAEDIKFGDIVLYPQTSRIPYTIKWKIDESVVEEIYYYEENPVFKGNTDKARTQQYTYEFLGWEEENTKNAIYPVDKTTTYIAVYKETVNKYTYTFKNGESVYTTATVDYGTKINAPTDPIKEPTVDKVFTFDKWTYQDGENAVEFTNDFGIVDDITFIANYTEETRKYTVTWLDKDGELIESYEIEYGSCVTEKEEYSTYKETYTEGTKEFAFWQWSYDINQPILCDTIIKALFKSTALTYTYVFILDNGSQDVPGYSEIESPIVVPEEIRTPQKQADACYSYTFATWYIDANNNNEYDAGEELTNNSGIDAVANSNIIIKAHYNKTPQKYRITFNETDLAPIELEYGANIAIENPTKTGYRFDSWDKEVPATMPAEDVTITALWLINSYKITFNTDGGSEIAAIEQEYNTEITKPADPTKTGHTFSGWDREVPATMPAENITITASWSINSYKITFELDNGSADVELILPYNKVIEAPADPTKTGYTFSAWDKEVPATMPAEDMTIKAIYTANEYNITYDLNYEGATAIEGKTVIFDSPYGELAAPKRLGYTFLGWKLNNVAIDAETLVTTPDDHTLVASWLINNYTITFELNNGSEDIKLTQAYNTEITAPADPTKTGHTFSGWSATIPATMPAGDMTIKATYTINSYTITFNTDGGSEIAAIEQEYNTEITAPADPTKTGYTFSGWDREVPATMPAENITITASWSINSYTITFDTDGGSEIAAIKQKYNTPITKPADPTKTGHTFSGWDREVPATMPAENITITASWSINSYTITFKLNNGSEDIKLTQAYNTVVEAPTNLTKTGHTFSAWDREVPATMPAEDVTIIALWSINSYTITFDTDGGSEITAIKQEYNTPITKPADPTKTGYTFSAWDQQIPEFMPAGDMTIKAIYTANKYNITYDLNYEGATAIEGKPVIFDSPYGELAAPERLGYSFLGWKLNNITVNAETLVATPDNHTLVASWEAIAYTITYVNPFGIVVDSSTYTIENAPVLTTPINSEEYSFDAWYIDQDYSAMTPVYEVGTYGNFTVYGNWFSTGLTFNLLAETDTYEVVELDYESTLTNIYIPKMYQGKRITDIAQGAMYGASVETVDMRYIKHVGLNVFNKATALTTITISSELEKVDAFAFDSTNLTTIYVATPQEEFNFDAITVNNSRNGNSLFINANLEYLE